MLNQVRTANTNGYYVLPHVPGAGSYQIHADCDGFETSQSVSLSALQLTGGSPVNLQLVNSRPHITSVTAVSNGTMVQQAAPGSTLTVRVAAYDPYWRSIGDKRATVRGVFPAKIHPRFNGLYPPLQR